MYSLPYALKEVQLHQHLQHHHSSYTATSFAKFIAIISPPCVSAFRGGARAGRAACNYCTSIYYMPTDERSTPPPSDYTRAPAAPRCVAQRSFPLKAQLKGEKRHALVVGRHTLHCWPIARVRSCHWQQQ